MHSLGFVHNDLKLENILIGFRDPSLLYLIDFGLSYSYLKIDGQHKEKKYTGNFSGNFLFASLNSCRGNNKSRRDDVESALYIMIYLLNDKYLPWLELESKIRKSGMTLRELLNEWLEYQYTKKLLNMVNGT